ncbi:MAG: hypothetical protein IJD92_01965 [Bacilli bacterium]|nr:hypothetical protein [Bacilli bacterium]
MRKKTIIGLFIIMAFIGIKEVSADNSSAYPGQPHYETLKSSYNNFKSNLPSVTVSSTRKTVTLYGQSICSTETSSCEYNYAGYTVNDNQEDVISDIVSCSNGEKYIIYQSTGSGKDAFKDDNKANYDSGPNNEPAYWSEDYSVQCSNDNTTSNGEVIENEKDSNDGNGSNGNGSNAGNDYNGSTTVPPVDTGVETYYIILGIVGLLTYGLMAVVKKHNLFKKI